MAPIAALRGVTMHNERPPTGTLARTGSVLAAALVIFTAPLGKWWYTAGGRSYATPLCVTVPFFCHNRSVTGRHITHTIYSVLQQTVNSAFLLTRC
jgi:hypothetical protein